MIMNKERLMQLEIVRRNSKQKNIILASVKKLGNHPTADEVFIEARKLLPSISLSTVYRNLAILSKNGDLLSINNLSSEIHFDHNTTRHFHVYCSTCGKVGDIYLPDNSIEMLFPEKSHGFQIDGFSVTFNGTCNNCSILKNSKGE